MGKNVLALIVSFTMSACATTPPVTMTYYPARSGISVKLVRTVACDNQDLPIVATTPTVTVHQRADFTSPREMSLAGIDGPLANSDVKLEFYGDRRLKSVNATTAGQGQTIIKAVVSLASATMVRSARNPYATQCKLLKQHFGDEPLTLIFVAEDPLDGTGQRVPIVADSQSAHYQDLFPTLIGDACFSVGEPQGRQQPVSLPSRGHRYALLRMRQPAYVPVTVSIGPPGSCGQTSVWNEMVPVGQKGVDYEMPIPKAAAFGKQTFAATWDESGALTSIQYAKDDGSASATDTLRDVYDTANRTDAEKAAAATSEADLIKAQQRLVRCRATPASCD